MKYENVVDAYQLKHLIDNLTYAIDYFIEGKTNPEEPLIVRRGVSMKTPTGDISLYKETKIAISDLIIDTLEKRRDEAYKELEQL